MQKVLQIFRSNFWCFIIKPMNEEDEVSPLEGPRVHRNRLARERHTARSKEQRAADASRWEGQRARSAKCELDRANQGGNQVIPLARHEFDDNHHGLHHTLGEMTTMCGKCGALDFLEERVASSLRANPQFTAWSPPISLNQERDTQRRKAIFFFFFNLLFLKSSPWNILLATSPCARWRCGST